MIRRLLAGFATSLLAACAGAPAAQAPAWSRASPNGQFVVTLVPPQEIPLQDIHEWRVKVATADGQPVTQALVYVNGGMPAHGHGLPTRPQVTRELQPGTYLIEGMKFSMPGRWEILVAVQKVPASDVTPFEFDVPGR
jgi:hypothetical protein